MVGPFPSISFIYSIPVPCVFEPFMLIIICFINDANHPGNGILFQQDDLTMVEPWFNNGKLTMIYPGSTIFFCFFYVLNSRF